VVLVDTNILAYLLIEGDRTTAAQRLYARDPDWRSEEFILVELSNVIATHVRLQALAQEQGARLLAEAQALIPEPASVSHAKALEVANHYGISAYDARFVALAMQMRRVLVTEDTKLRAAVPDWTTSLAAAAG
jgi:predicted nucleic acid-binding protein